MALRSVQTAGFPRISAGVLRAVIFALLVILALGFWLYMQWIVDHVRELQKTTITYQKEIYKGILSSDAGMVSSELFQTGVIESKFPVIFTDADGDPIEGLWRNVAVDSSKTHEQIDDQLRSIARSMDAVNPPDTIFIQTLRREINTLTVYDSPPLAVLPFAITDQVGNPLYLRNIPTDIGDLTRLLSEIDPDPIRFSADGRPPIIVYGSTGQGIWPVVITTSDGRALYWKGIGVTWTPDAAYEGEELDRRLRIMRRQGNVESIRTTDVTVYEPRLLHYGDPAFLSFIVWLPVIEFGVITVIIVIGFIGLKNITRAEQHSIWVGMAKETAHQLGTPISSIDGWLELLKTERDEALIDQAVEEIGVDVDRLTRVAARFSSIGSRPELQPIDVSDVIEEVLDYFRKRVPRQGRRILLSCSREHLRTVNANRELLNWAFENLVKNAIAAIEKTDGRITVTASMTKTFDAVVIDFIDNGKGIPPADQAKIMQPGFTTKKRGWGLGLSLVKRIIEDYHGGSVSLLESRPGEGTTIRIVLPAQERRDGSL